MEYAWTKMLAHQLSVLDLLRTMEILVCRLQASNQIQVALALELNLYGALGHMVVVIQSQMQIRQVATTN